IAISSPANTASRGAPRAYARAASAATYSPRTQVGYAATDGLMFLQLRSPPRQGEQRDDGSFRDDGRRNRLVDPQPAGSAQRILPGDAAGIGGSAPTAERRWCRGCGGHPRGRARVLRRRRRQDDADSRSTGLRGEGRWSAPDAPTADAAA